MFKVNNFIINNNNNNKNNKVSKKIEKNKKKIFEISNFKTKNKSEKKPYCIVYAIFSSKIKLQLGVIREQTTFVVVVVEKKRALILTIRCATCICCII